MAEKKEIKPLLALSSVAGMAGGWAFSEYCGACAWIPGGMALLLLLLFAKTPLRPRWFRGAIAVTGGHVTWFIVACVLSGNVQAVIIDIAMLLAGIIWLWVRPGIAAVIFLGLVQLASLAINVSLLASTHFGELASRALTAHITFRVIAVICLIGGLIKMRKDLSTPVSDVTIANDDGSSPDA